MRILVVGSGGREHAICWKISQNRNVEKYFVLLEMEEFSLFRKGRKCRHKRGR